MREHPPKPDLLVANSLEDATERVIRKPWKVEEFEIYLTLAETPGRITLDASRLRDIGQGNKTPLEWRLEEEYGTDYDVRGDLRQLVNDWLNSVVEVPPAGDRND